MTKYAIFSGERYYPLGGWEDLKGIYSDTSEIKNKYSVLRNNPNIAWIQIVNLKTFKIIKTYQSRYI